MLAVPAPRQLATQTVPRTVSGWVSVVDITCEQLFDLMDDRQAIFERHIATLVLPQQSAPIRLARRRVMRIRTAPILLIEHTRLSETDRVVIELLDREAQLAD